MPKKNSAPKKPIVQEVIDDRSEPIQEQEQFQAVELPPQKSARSKTILALLLFVIIVLAVVCVAKYVMDDDDNTYKSNSTNNASQNVAGQVLCLSVGLRSIQCEDLKTNELRKYTLPDAPEQIVSISPNATADKYIVRGWERDVKDEYLAIHDGQMKFMRKLPSQQDESSGTSDLQSLAWLDSDTVIYTRSIDISKPGKIVYSFNTETGEETELYTSEVGMNEVMTTGNDKYLIAKVRAGEDGNETDLAILNISTQKAVAVDASAHGADEYALHSDGTSTYLYYEFYDDTDPASPQSRIVKYDIEDTYSESPKLNVVARINNASLLHSAAVMTINGLLVDEQTGDDIEQLATLYSDTGTKTTPKLYRAGGRVEAAFALAEFPTLPSAQTNEVAASDFYVAASDAPAKINTFLADYSENNPDCSDGEYVTLELDRFDGDKQFGVFQSGCEKIGLAVFKQNGDSYKIVTTLLEGITCERRDELGISEKVAECFKPGEGI